MPAIALFVLIRIVIHSIPYCQRHGQTGFGLPAFQQRPKFGADGIEQAVCHLFRQKKRPLGMSEQFAIRTERRVWSVRT
jgi:hypothetical protein